jgi:hypothetical protein
LIALGDVLGCPYRPSLVRDSGESIVLRVPNEFLRAVAAADASVAVDEITALLREMGAFARAAVAGPGVVPFPLF